MEKLLVNVLGREKRFALLRDDEIETIFLDRPEHRTLVGNIYYGTVTKVLPGMNAVFVDIGEEKNAYLHRDSLPSFVQADDKKKNVSSYVHQGEKLLVQVEKDASGTKGAKVTGIIVIQGNGLVYMPNGRYIAVSKKIADEKQRSLLHKMGTRLKTEEEGLIFRTASLSNGEDELAQELDKLRRQYADLLRQVAACKKPGLIFQKDSYADSLHETISKISAGDVMVDDLSLKKRLEEQVKNPQIHFTYYTGKENIFAAHLVEQEIDKALKRLVWLANGAYLVFDQTEALTIIDVNTGKFSGKGDYQDTVLKTNQLAALEVSRQLRLRDIGGIVLIDFIDMKREQDKLSILELLKAEFEKDEKRTKLIGFTELGILQLTRKKTKVALSEAMQVKCPVCAGTGRVLSAETVAFRLERELLGYRSGDFEAVLVETTSEVQAALLGPDRAHGQILEEMLRFKLYFSIKESIEHQFVVKQFGTIAEIASKI